MELEHVLQAHPGNCICIEFDKTGKYFAVGSADALVSLWDVQSLACVRTFSRLVIHSSFHSFFLLLLDFGLSRLTSLQFIQYHVAEFYKPTIPQSPPSHLQDYSTCNNARLEFSTIFAPSFDPNEWCLKKWSP
jgi:WD40 repeat protein